MQLTDITTAIAALGDPQLWRHTDIELGELLPVPHAAIHTLEAARIAVLQELDSRHANAAPPDPDTGIYPDTATWIAATSTLSTDTARRLNRVATALGRHPEIAATYHAGRINLDDARIITSFLDRPPHTIPTEALDDCRDYLLLAADGGDTRSLRRALTALLARFPGTDGPPAENTLRNEFWASVVGGRVIVKGDLDTETGDMLLAALSPLSEPAWLRRRLSVPGEDESHGTAEVSTRVAGTGHRDGGGGAS